MLNLVYLGSPIFANLCCIGRGGWCRMGTDTQGGFEVMRLPKEVMGICVKDATQGLLIFAPRVWRVDAAATVP
jgi:hypothetical protein